MYNSNNEKFVMIRGIKFPIEDYNLDLQNFHFDSISEIEGLDKADLLSMYLDLCTISKIEGLGHLTDLTYLNAL